MFGSISPVTRTRPATLADIRQPSRQRYRVTKILCPNLPLKARGWLPSAPRLIRYQQTTHAIANFNEEQKSQEIYRNEWGGDDLHVGIYSDEVDKPSEAARATTDRMLRLLPRIKKSTRMLVLQSGFGTAARYIAETHMCKVECLNDNEVQNAYNEEQIEAAELTKLMNVTLGDIDYMPYSPDYFDFVVAQDSFSITAQKRQMFRAIHRVMKPEARLIFCAIMRADKVSPAGEERIASLPVEELITAADYENDARRGFFQQVYKLDLSKNLATHFAKLEESLEENRKEMVKQTSEAFVAERKRICHIFRELAEDGDLRWGIMMFQKLNS